jgi:hypothetical protein
MTTGGETLLEVTDNLALMRKKTEEVSEQCRILWQGNNPHIRDYKRDVTLNFKTIYLPSVVVTIADRIEDVAVSYRFVPRTLFQW